MPSRADYKCPACGFRDEFLFDHTPPAHHTHIHSEVPGKPCGLTQLVRVWSPPHTGRGSSGEPPR